MTITAAAAKLVGSVRKRAGLSQRQVAEAAGLDRTYISHLESGRRCPSLEALDAVLRACGSRLVLTAATEERE